MPARKGFIIPILLLGIVTIIFTLGVLSFNTNFSQKDKNLQNSEKTEVDRFPGWKTYQNKSSEYTIRYPKQWYVKEYGDYAADFVAVDPKGGEASPSSIKVRFSRSSENADIREFEKIHKLKDDQKILEPLDVRSEITKNKNFKIGSYEAIDFQIERDFSAPVGPRKEFSRVYEINKGSVVLKFSTHAQNLEEQIKFNDATLSKMISSIYFQD